MKEITRETVELLLELTKSTIGDKGVRTLLNRTSENLSGRELVYNIASAVMDVYGDKGSYAIVRQLGRDLAKKLMKKYPKDMWQWVLENSLRELGFAQRIELIQDEACICSCVFYEILQKDGLNPTEHAVCWCGWGFIEGFVREMKRVTGIEWKYRDAQKEQCWFRFIK